MLMVTLTMGCSQMVTLTLVMLSRHHRNLDPIEWACDAEGQERVCEVTATKPQKRKKSPRAPRIRVPNSERALFTIDDGHFVGVLQRLSLSGGSALLSKGPIPKGTMADIDLKTSMEEFTPRSNFFTLAPMAFRSPRRSASSRWDRQARTALPLLPNRLEKEGYSDVTQTGMDAFTTSASAAVGKLLSSIRRLASTTVASRA